MNMLKMTLVLLCAIAVLSFGARAAEETTEKKTEKANAVKDKDDGGDTYNFYFQKAPGANKVKQGTEQQVQPEQESAMEPDTAEKEKQTEEQSHASDRASELSTDLFGGLVSIPAQSAFGLGLGIHGNVAEKFGFRIGLFSAASSSKNEPRDSSFTAFGIDENSNKRNIYGAEVGISYDFARTRKARVGALLGAHLLNDEHTTKSHSFSAFGSSDSTTSTSSFGVNPYLGLSGTAYLSKNFGANLSVLVPFTPRYTTIAASLVICI